MCGDRIGGTPTPDRCQTCSDMHWLIENDTKLAREIYDRYVLETFLHNKPDAFRQTLIELE
jgi:hypothetical protein